MIAISTATTFFKRLVGTPHKVIDFRMQIKRRKQRDEMPMFLIKHDVHILYTSPYSLGKSVWNSSWGFHKDRVSDFLGREADPWSQNSDMTKTDDHRPSNHNTAV